MNFRKRFCLSAGGQKMEGFQGRKFFAREPLRFCTAPQARHWSVSGISDKMSSSGVINILHNLTFRNFPDFFVGGAERRPLIFWLAAHGAARQTEVRYPLRFFVFALPKKEFLLYYKCLPQIMIAYFNGRLWTTLSNHCGCTKGGHLSFNN